MKISEIIWAKKNGKSSGNGGVSVLHEDAGKLLEELEAYRAKANAQAEELQLCRAEIEMQEKEIREARERLGEALTRYADLYDLAPVAYFSFDSAGNIMGANLAAARMLGVERRYLQGRAFDLYLHPKEKKVFHSHLRESFDTGGCKPCELEIGTNGSRIIAQITSVRDESRTYLCRSTVENITEQKDARRILSEARPSSTEDNIWGSPAVANDVCPDNAGQERTESERAGSIEEKFGFLNEGMEMILREFPLGVLIAEAPSGKPVYVNANLCEILGSTDRLSYHMYWSPRYPDGSTYEPDNVPLARAMRGRIVKMEEMSFPGGGGALIPVRSSAWPIFDGKGDIVAAVMTFEDISERKNCEREVKKLTEELKRADADLHEFAYNASRELRSPLRHVEGFLKALNRKCGGILDDEIQSLATRISRSADEANSLLKDLRDYSRAAGVRKSFVPADTSACAAAGIRNLSVAISEKDAEILSEAETLPVVSGNASDLMLLFEKIIENALKFCQKSPKVRIWAERKDDWHIFSIEDNGVGMDGENIQRIFAAFQRLHGKTEYPGNGMGLAICKKIVERHGGQIWAESELGRGSVFRFSIPVTA